MSVARDSPANWEELPAARDASPASFSLAVLSSRLQRLDKLALLGVGLIVFGGWFLLENANHLIRGQRTQGIVIGHEARHRARSGTTYAPVVEYTVEKQQYRLVGRASSDLLTYKINQPVAVLYLAHDPASGRIADFMQLYLISTITGVAGVFCLAVSFATSKPALSSEE